MKPLEKTPPERSGEGRADARILVAAVRAAVPFAWRDGLFLTLAGAALAAAAHAGGVAVDGGRPLVVRLAGLLEPASMVAASLPLLLGLAALVGPLLMRTRWQTSVLALGIAWLGAAALALAQERVFGQSFAVVPGGIGLAALAALVVLIQPRERRPEPPTGTRAAAGAGVTAPA